MMDCVKIRLNDGDVQWGMKVGYLRTTNNYFNPRVTNQRYSKRGDFDVSIIGALGELVVSRYYGLVWPGDFDRPRPDRDIIAHDKVLQVKTTVSWPRGLFVPLGAAASHNYFLVTGRPSDYRNWEIVGWCVARDAMKEKYAWRQARANNTPGGIEEITVYCVPVGDLNSPEFPPWDREAGNVAVNR